MDLSDSQQSTVSTWIADGKSLADVQRMLREEFSISMTYMDVRFLVDDLDIVFAEPEVSEEVGCRIRGARSRRCAACRRDELTWMRSRAPAHW